jgi:uncharacterized protein YqeY
MSTLQSTLKAAMISAMKAKEKERLQVIRLILAEVKQREVDERITLSDEQILALLDKMVKQRKNAIEQFLAGDRSDLAEQETFEITVIHEFLPTPFTEAEVEVAIEGALKESEAVSMKDMGKVMAILKPALQGRADMSVVSKHLKERLS